jgi:hypothetical protein
VHGSCICTWHDTCVTKTYTVQSFGTLYVLRSGRVPSVVQTWESERCVQCGRTLDNTFLLGHYGALCCLIVGPTTLGLYLDWTTICIWKRDVMCNLKYDKLGLIILLLLRSQSSCLGLNSFEALVMDNYKRYVYFCISSAALVFCLFVCLFLLAYVATLFQLGPRVS